MFRSGAEASHYHDISLPSARGRYMISTRCFIFFVLFYPIIRNGNCDNSSESLGDTSGSSAQTSNDDDATTSEVHYANCKIVMDNLSVDAQAKFTRVLPRTLTGKIIEERFENLEKLLNERLNDLRELIVRLTTNSNPSFTEPKDDTMRIQMSYATENRIKRNIFAFHENYFVPISGNDTDNLVHQKEIDHYNNTVREISVQRKIYTYYWRVLNLSDKLSKRSIGRSERSSSFYVADAGYAMYMTFTPKYFPDGPILISVGLTTGHNDSKILWPFQLQVRVEIPDLNRDPRLWDPATVCSPSFGQRPQGNIIAGTIIDSPECAVLRIPRQYLIQRGRKYISNDSLLVKLTVIL